MNAWFFRACVAALLSSSPPLSLAHPGHDTQLQRVDTLLQTHATNQALYIKRGTLLVMSEHWDLADQAFTAAEKLGDAREVGRAKGMMHLTRGERDQAVQQLTLYLQLHPLDAQALLLRARAQTDPHKAVGDYRAHFSATSQPHPGDFLAAARLLAETRPSQAIELIDLGLETTGMQAQLQRFAIDIEANHGRFAAAIARCRALEPQLHRNPAWHLDLAELLLANGQPTRAAVSLEAAQARLRTLKPTPATAALQQRLSELMPSGRIAG